MKNILYFIKKIYQFTGNILIFNIIFLFIISLFEGMGMFLLIPLISSLDIVEFSGSNEPLLNWFKNLFSFIHEDYRLGFILFVFLLIMIGQGYFQRSQMVLGIKIQQAFLRHLKESLYKHIWESNWAFFIKKRKSELIHVMTAEINRVSTGVSTFFQLISTFIFTLVQFSISFWLSWQLTSAVLILGFILLFSSRVFIKQSSSLGKETIELHQEILSGVMDQLNGIKEVKSNRIENDCLDWFQTTNEKVENNIVKMAKVNATSQLLYKILLAFLVSVFLYVSINMYQSNLAELILIMIIFSRLWPRFSGIQSKLEQLASVSPSFRVLINIQNECERHKELTFMEENNQQNPIEINEELSCKQVSFRYEKGSKYAVKDVSITIPVHSMTAIVGPSGAGKSTLIDILMGLNNPESGEVLIDGVPLSTDEKVILRDKISYVPQEPFLFSGSIRENLVMMRKGATDEELWNALHFSAADTFVKDLPEGLDTMLGDRGIRLSGGERQRIVLARAILRSPSILILDEATSSLDTENERKIKNSLDQLRGKMTVIVIAHRLSTIENADQVVVLEDGQVTQKGRYNQLAKKEKGTFQRLIASQVN
ncbi:ABC transporter ATP-binding protein [Bacillus carboniphilus]|uniref:ABC transporter ATP-binding protein n=1 Tax=Bacillus carboniphilus TaxID=86663 RepID=A0ABY9JW92_9BACI|nr:ABC transporter ATP-binding protein [Bacillus carboniphilus]WLR42778.1 ABC transporter ATP-binding protein [Bacillus carboniphilus]